jgi:hypothetical protein
VCAERIGVLAVCAEFIGVLARCVLSVLASWLCVC